METEQNSNNSLPPANNEPKKRKNWQFIRNKIRSDVRKVGAGSIKQLSRKYDIREETVVQYLDDPATKEAVKRWVAAEILIAVPSIVARILKIATEGTGEVCRRACVDLLQMIDADKNLLDGIAGEDSVLKEYTDGEIKKMVAESNGQSRETA